MFLDITKAVESQQKNALDKFRFSDSDSEQIWSLLLKLKTISTCFEHDSFHNSLKDNIYEQFYIKKYSRLLPKKESITNFFVGIILQPKMPRNYPWWSHLLI